MGRRGNARVIQKKSANMKEDVSNVTSMFNQMLGTERPDAMVVKPKYEELLKVLMTTSDKITKFAQTVINKMFPEHVEHFRSMIKFSVDIQRKCIELGIKDLPSDVTLWKDHYNTMVDNYLKLKECDVVKRLIKVCGALKKQKRYIGDVDNLSAQFIMDSAEPDFCILGEFTQLPFKQMFIDDRMRDRPEAKAYVLNFLNILWERTYELYKIITSPDVDVDKFVEIVSSSIDQVKKQIPRCNDAFDKIKNATHMLKDNFGDYYKDFVESENPSIIMENFISDVANGTDGDPKLVGQFKRIIGFYKKNAAAHMQKNPQLKQVFSMVNSQLSALDDLAGDKKKKSKDSESVESDGESDEISKELTPEEQAAKEKEEARIAKRDARVARNKAKNKEKKQTKKKR